MDSGSGKGLIGSVIRNEKVYGALTQVAHLLLPSKYKLRTNRTEFEAPSLSLAFILSCLQVKTLETQHDAEVLRRTGIQDENKQLIDQVAQLSTKEKQLNKVGLLGGLR